MMTTICFEIESVKDDAKTELVDLFRRSILSGIRIRLANNSLIKMFGEVTPLMNTPPYNKLHGFFKTYVDLFSKTISQNFAQADSCLSLLRYGVTQSLCNQMSDQFKDIDENGLRALQTEMNDFASTL